MEDWPIDVDADLKEGSVLVKVRTVQAACLEQYDNLANLANLVPFLFRSHRLSVPSSLNATQSAQVSI